MAIRSQPRDTAAIEHLRRRVSDFSWYHKVDLGDDVVTPGLELDHLSDGIRQTTRNIDCKPKHVRDPASFDSMWAFGAEQVGAAVLEDQASYMVLQRCAARTRPHPR
jgi:hypothetical protein